MLDWWLIAHSVPFALMLAVGAFILLRHRHRSRKATGLAFIALCGFAGWWLFDVVLVLAFPLWKSSVADDRFVTLVTIVDGCRQLCHGACVLLLVFAIVIDRRDGRSDDVRW